jgi:Protein of unknown function (DUF5672)
MLKNAANRLATNRPDVCVDTGQGGAKTKDLEYAAIFSPRALMSASSPASANCQRRPVIFRGRAWAAKNKVCKMSGNAKKVGVVVPLYRFPLHKDEEISLWHLKKHLGRFDRFLIGPRQLPVGFSDFRLRLFPSEFFQSVHGYSRLLLSRNFYHAFREYEFILIYQLDCLVFSGNLDYWCCQDWDYVGAPWFPGFAEENSKGFWKVGNGGLSLRKVSSAIRVLESKVLAEDPVTRGQQIRWFRSQPFLRRMACWLATRLHARGYKNNVRSFVQSCCLDPGFHEDLFWAFEAKRFMPGFRIPSPEEAVAFSFEKAPRYCYQVNNRKLPFGCHAWSKYDRAFWQEHILDRSSKHTKDVHEKASFGDGAARINVV